MLFSSRIFRVGTMSDDPYDLARVSIRNIAAHNRDISELTPEQRLARERFDGEALNPGLRSWRWSSLILVVVSLARCRRK